MVQFGLLAPVWYTAHIGRLLFPFVFYLCLETVIPSAFPKPHYYMNLPPLAVCTRALVTHFLLWIVFPSPSRMDSAALSVGLWFAHCLLVYTDPESVCFSFVKFTPSVPHIKWHPLSLLQIPCRITASPLVFQSVFVQVVVLSQV